MSYCNEFHKMKSTNPEPRNPNPDFRFLFFRRKIWRIWYESIMAILKSIFFMCVFYMDFVAY